MLKSNIFNIKNDDGLLYIQIEAFNNTKKVNHCFSTSLGGVSKHEYKSLNLGFNRGDNEDNVRENFRLLCNAINVNTNNLVFSNQVHKDNILIVKAEDRGKGYIKESDIIEIDGLITNDRNVALVTFYADCVPLLFFDPVKEVIGASHAGWKGTVLKIGNKTIKKMVENFGSNPKDILVGIMPSICGKCFEVGEEVKIEFEKSLSHDIIEKIMKKHKKDKWLIDLWKCNEEILLESGILKDNISVTDICTRCNNDYFFSHRFHGGKRGSLGAIIELK